MQKTVGPSPGLRMLVRALCVYVLSAFLFLVLASFLLARSNVGSHVLGYVSSAISFLSSFLSTSFSFCARVRRLIAYSRLRADDADSCSSK